MNEQFNRDVAKYIKETPLNQELTPGSTPRRYEPVDGIGKHNKRIHKESKVSDSKNLDFTFRKPLKPVGRQAYIRCDNCGFVTVATTITAGIICRNCHEFSTVTELIYNG
jgi:hypothetical protein